MTRFPFHLQISGLAQGEQARKVHVDVEVLMNERFRAYHGWLTSFETISRTKFYGLFCSTSFFPPNLCRKRVGSGLQVRSVPQVCGLSRWFFFGGGISVSNWSDFSPLETEEKWPIDPCVPWRRNDVLWLFLFSHRSEVGRVSCFFVLIIFVV